VAGVSSEKSDNKLNVELNLVPFIDLLSSLTLFLLVTAVWIQVGTIPASVESSGKARFSSSEDNHLTIHLTPSGFQLTWPTSVKTRGNLPKSLANSRGQFDFSRLEKILNLMPKMKVMPLAAVTSEDSVEYGNVVETIDAIKKSGFTIVALGTN
jgi:biopolymer transport protein TolR